MEPKLTDAEKAESLKDDLNTFGFCDFSPNSARLLLESGYFDKYAAVKESEEE